MGSPFNPFQSGGPGGSAASPGGPISGGVPNSAPPRASDSTDLTVAEPPVTLLAVAAATALIGAVVAIIMWATWIAVIGWVLAGPVAIGVMANFVFKDTERRAEPVYLQPQWMTLAYVGVAVITLVSIFASALSVAYWAGRL